MRTFLGTVLSVIAVGVLLIAYGLLGPGASANGSVWNNVPLAADPRGGAQFRLRCEPGQRVMTHQDDWADEAACVDISPVDRYSSIRTPVAYQTRESWARPTDERYQAPRRTPVRVVRRSGRDWRKTALVIGGTTAAGAGLGAIFGGSKGALIGAAIGGGGSSIYEAGKR
jgi:hypothetical protein